MQKKITWFAIIFLFSLLSANVADARADGEPPRVWLDTVVSITSRFETSSASEEDWFSAVTRDFDCQGLSLGALNWTIASGSFFEMIHTVDVNDLDLIVQSTMPNYGREWLQVLNFGKNNELSNALEIVRGWQRPNFVSSDCADRKREGVTFESETIVSELSGFMLHPTIVEAQKNAMETKSNRAFRLASSWARMARGVNATPRFNEYALFFDLSTQNGYGYLNQLMELVNRVTQNGPSLQWSHNRAATSWMQIQWDDVSSAHRRDGRRNAIRWRGAYDGGQIPNSDNALLLLATFRGMLSHRQYSTDVMNRKGTMILGFGWVHGHYYDNRELYQSMDDIVGN